jgi:hypothetical protein
MFIMPFVVFSSQAYFRIAYINVLNAFSYVQFSFVNSLSVNLQVIFAYMNGASIFSYVHLFFLRVSMCVFVCGNGVCVL